MTSGAIFSFLTNFCFINVQYEFYRTCMNVIIHPVKPVESRHVTSVEAVVDPTRYATVPATITLWLLGEGVERPIVNLGMDFESKGAHHIGDRMGAGVHLRSSGGLLPNTCLPNWTNSGSPHPYVSPQMLKVGRSGHGT